MFKGVCALNLLARDATNAKEVAEAVGGHLAIGVMVKEVQDLKDAIVRVLEIKDAVGLVSVGLGAGDPSQWERVVEVAAATDPGHVNQVFPAAAYTVGYLKAKGLRENIVNALVSPSGRIGEVVISTGPRSEKSRPALVQAETAAAMLREVGVSSVKFFPAGGDSRMEEVKAMAQAAAKAGIPIFEPTGGIDEKNIGAVVSACVEAGCQVVVPHVYTAIVDKSTGLTSPAAAAALFRELKKVLG
ncbi:MAG: KDGP aldolase [Firmicutes bacterium]|nr:KDGP aldolase [Bacillota bacterium]